MSRVSTTTTMTRSADANEKGQKITTALIMQQDEEKQKDGLGCSFRGGPK